MDIKLIKERMDASIKFFEKELSTLRTSRAHPSILDYIYVDAYGVKTPINQLGNISVPEANMITIQVWDVSLTKVVEKSITFFKICIFVLTFGLTFNAPSVIISGLSSFSNVMCHI